MRIQKSKVAKSNVKSSKKVNASEVLVVNEMDGCYNDNAQCESAVSQVCDKYAEAICSIQAAIECLACCAKEDPVAKDSIANLSVVLFDLKSNC